MPAIGKTKTKKAAKPVATETRAPERPVVHDKLDVSLFLAEEGNLITATYAKELLGWRTTTEREESQFEDMEGTMIVCDHNTRNRPFDRKTSLAYAQDILNRHWADSQNSKPDDSEPMTLNGETIIIDRYGEVDSGQHRLIGLVFAAQIWEGIGSLSSKQKPQKGHWQDLWPEEPSMEGIIVFGVSGSPRVKRTLDNVRPRDLSDVLYTSGIATDKKPVERDRLTRVLAYALRYLWYRVWGNLDSFNPAHTHSQMLDLLERHGGANGRLVEAVKHIAEEDVYPTQKNGEGKQVPIPNSKRKISRFVPPGTASGMAYLMGCAQSDETAYRNAEPQPHEGVLDWSLWDRALEFFTALAKGEADFKEVRNAIDELMDPETGERGGSPAERQAILAKAWERWSLNRRIREEDVKLTDDLYQIHRDHEGNLVSRTLVIHPKLGGIDGGEPQEIGTPGETQEPTPEELEAAREPKGGIRTNGDSPEEEKQARERMENGTGGEPPSLEEQLNDLKSQHPDKLLVFRRAGVYGTWGDDTTVFKEVLKAEVQTVSGLKYAEFKAKNLAGNMLKLLQAGHKVAICEQVKGQTQVTDYDAPATTANGKKSKK